MYQLSISNEKGLNPFHRKQFFISIHDLPDMGRFESDRFFSVESTKRLFPNASQATIANLLLTTLQIRWQKGDRQFMVVFDDNTRVEALDLFSGLHAVFESLDPTRERQTMFRSQLQEYAASWTELLVQEEKGLSRIGILLNT